MAKKMAISKDSLIRNPDVVLREENTDGGLLFNPDTNQVKIVNATGLFIWKQFEKPQELETVVTAMQNAFDGVPQDGILVDIKAFLDDMVQSGFIGKIETE